MQHMFTTAIVPLLNGAPVDVSLALIQVLRAILLQNGAEWTRSKVSTRKLLVVTLDSYRREKFAKDVRTKALVLLCDIVLNVKLCQLYG